MMTYLSMRISTADLMFVGIILSLQYNKNDDK